MRRYIKIFLWTCAALLFLLAFLVLVSPRLIRPDDMRAEAQSILSHHLQGEISLGRFDLLFLPRPHILILDTRVTVSPAIKARLPLIKVFPKIWPLLLGQTAVARVDMHRPDVGADMAAQQVALLANAERMPESCGIDLLIQRISSGLSSVAALAPDLEVWVRKGRVTLTGSGSTVLEFRDVDMRLQTPGQDFGLTLQCRSNLWRKMVVSGRYDPENVQGKGQVSLSDCRLEHLTGYLLSGATPRIADSSVNFKLDWQADGAHAVQAAITGSIPHMTLLKAGGESLLIKDGYLRALINADADHMTATLSELVLAEPQVNLAGRIRRNRATHKIDLALSGRNLDVETVHKSSLFLAGKSDLTQAIFDIIRGGGVPRFFFKTQGQRLKELGQLKNMTLTGQLQDGRIFVPKAELNLTGVQGGVVLAGGVLKVQNFKAQLNSSMGRQGDLQLGLAEDDGTFHLDVLLEADLANLPAILKRLVRHEAFVREMAYVQGVTGHARGRLVLHESPKGLSTQVDVSQFELTADYQRVAHPLHLKGGHFSYRDTRIDMDKLDCRLDSSFVTALSGHVSWEGTPVLDLKAGKSGVNLNQIHPWLTSFETLRGGLGKLNGLSGSLDLVKTQVKGPLIQPDKWDFQTSGHARNLTLTTARFHEPIRVSSAAFDAGPDRLAFGEAKIRLLDAALEASGTLVGYLEALKQADIHFSGNMDSVAVGWIADAISLPPELHIRTPVKFFGSHLGWDKQGKSTFSGKLAGPKGPVAWIDVSGTAHELALKQLEIKDRQSHCTLTLNRGGRGFALTFAGNLFSDTLKKLFRDFPYAFEWIKGDIGIETVKEDPPGTTVRGKIEGKGFQWPQGLKQPIDLARFTVNGAGKRLNVDSAVLHQGQNQMVLAGHIDFDHKKAVLDLDLEADGLILDAAPKGPVDAKESSGRHVGSAEKFWALPLQGTLRIRSESVAYGTYTWQPVQTQITFEKNRVRISVSEADLCGISFPGTLKLSPSALELEFRPIARNQPFDPAMGCLIDRRRLSTGEFDMDGLFRTWGTYENPGRYLQADLDFSARNGRIYRFNLLAKIFAFLNITEIFRGKMPDLMEEGFAYNAITASGNIRNGILKLEKFLIDGASMGIACEGDIMLEEKTLDLTVLIAPFKTLDLIINHIPLVSQIFGGTLVSIPVKVTGPWHDPLITPLSGTAVGSGVMGMMKRVLELPFKLIAPVFNNAGAGTQDAQ